MTTDERLKEIEARRGSFATHAQDDIQWLLALVKKQREALQTIVDGTYSVHKAVRRVMVDLAPIRAALNFNPDKP